MINICFSSDNNYAQHLGVTLASVLYNKNSEDEITVYILDGGISNENKNKIKNLQKKFDFDIKFVEIDKKLFEKFPRGKKNHVTLATYYRLLLPQLCPDIDKILYLDVDLIIKTSLKELYETDLRNMYFAGVSDCEEHINAPRLDLKAYCNAGVILLNLKKWREDNIIEKIYNWMKDNEEKIVLHDQDIINTVLQDGMIQLDRIWNVQISKYSTSKEFVKLLPEAKIIHYIGKHKPWHPDNKQLAKKEYFNYLKLTQWKNYIYKYYVQYTLNLPVMLITNLAHFIFSIEKQNGKKVVQILGIKI